MVRDYIVCWAISIQGELIEIGRGETVDLSNVPLSDAGTFEMLSRGDAVGVFQLESSGMRDVLRNLKPDTFEDIIAVVALYRPGPMDNIPSYIRRKHKIALDKKIILSVGSLIPEKGFVELIKAYAELKRDDLILIICGQGKEENNLKKLCSGLGVADKVIFTVK